MIIENRLSTVRNADRIFVFDGGELAERGTHSELLDVDGIYAELWIITSVTTNCEILLSLFRLLTDVTDIAEKVSEDIMKQVENNHTAHNPEVEVDGDAQFTLQFEVAELREQKSAIKDIVKEIENTKIVIDGAVRTPDVQIYQVEDGICTMKISVKKAD